MKRLLIVNTLLALLLTGCGGEGGKDFIGHDGLSPASGSGTSSKNLQEVSNLELVHDENDEEEIWIEGYNSDKNETVTLEFFGVRFPDDSRCLRDVEIYLRGEMLLDRFYYDTHNGKEKIYLTDDKDRDDRDYLNKLLVEEGYGVAWSDDFKADELLAEDEGRNNWGRCPEAMQEASRRNFEE